MAETTVLKVAMSCQGCVGAVKRAIGKLEGVESYDIDIKEQKVTVVGNIKPDTVLDRVAKTGKATSFWTDETAVKPASPPAPAEAVAVL